MSGEPKTLTLEQVLAELGRKDYALKMDPDAPGRPDPETGEYLPRWGVLNADGLVRSFGDTWPEAVSEAVGVPVVARDEAAELKAAVKRFLAAIDARDHFIEHEEELLPADWDAAFRRTGDEITDSVAALRRLAGGEEQE